MNKRNVVSLSKSTRSHLQVRQLRFGSDPTRKQLESYSFSVIAPDNLPISITSNTEVRINSKVGLRVLRGKTEVHLGTDISPLNRGAKDDGDRGYISIGLKKDTVVTVIKSLSNYSLHADNGNYSVLLNYLPEPSPEFKAMMERAAFRIPNYQKSQSAALSSQEKLVMTEDVKDAFVWKRQTFKEDPSATGPHIHVEIVDLRGTIYPLSTAMISQDTSVSPEEKSRPMIREQEQTSDIIRTDDKDKEEGEDITYEANYSGDEIVVTSERLPPKKKSESDDEEVLRKESFEGTKFQDVLRKILNDNDADDQLDEDSFNYGTI